MRQGARKRKHVNEHAAVTERLRAKSDQLRIEFAAADLDAATTFINLARLDFRSGECEHAARLLKNAERASEVVEGLLKKVPDHAALALRSKLEALNQAINQVKTQAS